MSEWGWVVAAYAVTWGVLAGYSISLRRRLARARAEYDAALRSSPSSGGS